VDTQNDPASPQFVEAEFFSEASHGHAVVTLAALLARFVGPPADRPGTRCIPNWNEVVSIEQLPAPPSQRLAHMYNLIKQAGKQNNFNPRIE